MVGPVKLADELPTVARTMAVADWAICCILNCCSVAADARDEAQMNNKGVKKRGIENEARRMWKSKWNS